MGITSYEDLNDCITSIIEYCLEREALFYVPLELVYQLKAEIDQITSDDTQD